MNEFELCFKQVNHFIRKHSKIKEEDIIISKIEEYFKYNNIELIKTKDGFSSYIDKESRDVIYTDRKLYFSYLEDFIDYIEYNNIKKLIYKNISKDNNRYLKFCIIIGYKI